MQNQYRRDSDTVVILYALRHPFTDLSVTKVPGDMIDVGIDVNGTYSGRLRFDETEAAQIMVQCFAEGRRPVATMIGKRVFWNIDPMTALFTRVIDDRGNLHDVRELVDG